MNRMLAIETSTECCSVALAVDEEVRETFEHAPMKHAELILPAVSSLLAEAGIRAADLDVISFGRGPGSFTSLRIGIGVVQGLAWGADVPVAPVSSLAAVAQGVVEHQNLGAASTAIEMKSRLKPLPHVLVAMDARMGEVFHAPFTAGEDGLVVSAGEERVSAPGDVAAEGGWIAAGNGFERYEELVKLAIGAEKCLPDAWPRASAVVTLANAWLRENEPLPAGLAQPVYIRNDVADKPASR